MISILGIYMLVLFILSAFLFTYTIDRNIINKVMPSLNSPTNESGVKAETMTNEHIVVLRKR